jgi:hypothetical protein
MWHVDRLTIALSKEHTSASQHRRIALHEQWKWRHLQLTKGKYASITIPNESHNLQPHLQNMSPFMAATALAVTTTNR